MDPLTQALIVFLVLSEVGQWLAIALIWINRVQGDVRTQEALTAIRSDVGGVKAELQALLSDERVLNLFLRLQGAAQPPRPAPRPRPAKPSPGVSIGTFNAAGGDTAIGPSASQTDQRGRDPDPDGRA